MIDVSQAVLKTKTVPVPSAPPAPSSEPPKAATIRKKRKRKPSEEDLRNADRSRFHKLYSETVTGWGRTLSQLSRIR